MSILDIFGSKVVQHVGEPDGTDESLPVGLSTITCTGYLRIAFVTPDGEVVNMFVLEPGLHRVNKPANVLSLIGCDADVEWSVRWPGRFDRHDPVRVSATLIRPRSQREEMQDFMHEMLARALRGDMASKLRSGEAVLDVGDEDYSDDEFDDVDSPMSVHQMSLVIDELQREIQSRSSAEPAEVSAVTGSEPVTPPPDPEPPSAA